MKILTLTLLDDTKISLNMDHMSVYTETSESTELSFGDLSKCYKVKETKQEIFRMLNDLELAGCVVMEGE